MMWLIVIGVPLGLIIYALADFGGLYNRVLIKLGMLSKCCEVKVVVWDLYHNSCEKCGSRVLKN